MVKVENFTVKANDGAELIKNITLTIPKGTITGLTGASGSGKTTLLRAIMGNLAPNHKIINGTVFIDDTDIKGLSKKEHRNLCGTTIGYIPQSPMTAFDNRVTVGNQLTEILCFKQKINKMQANQILCEKLKEFNFDNPSRIFESYPNQLSGGMLQRITVALLLILSPDYIFADEATSALDEKNATQLINILNSESKHRGILFVSHDVRAMEKLCQNMVVMQNGEVVETGSFDELVENPKCLWTKNFSSLWKNSKEEDWLWQEL